MPELSFDVKELIYQSPSPQTIDVEGRVSIGRQLARKLAKNDEKIIVYVVEAK